MPKNTDPSKLPAHQRDPYFKKWDKPMLAGPAHTTLLAMNKPSTVGVPRVQVSCPEGLALYQGKCVPRVAVNGGLLGAAGRPVRPVMQARYRVGAGDSTSGIARKLGVSVTALLRANPAKRTIVLGSGQRVFGGLVEGEVLKVPMSEAGRLASGPSDLGAPVQWYQSDGRAFGSDASVPAGATFVKVVRTIDANGNKVVRVIPSADGDLLVVPGAPLHFQSMAPITTRPEKSSSGWRFDLDNKPEGSLSTVAVMTGGKLANGDVIRLTSRGPFRLLLGWRLEYFSDLDWSAWGGAPRLAKARRQSYAPSNRGFVHGFTELGATGDACEEDADCNGGSCYFGYCLGGDSGGSSDGEDTSGGGGGSDATTSISGDIFCSGDNMKVSWGVPPTCVCDDGFVPNPNGGGCIPAATGGCPPGASYNTNGVCVWNDTGTPCGPKGCIQMNPLTPDPCGPGFDLNTEGQCVSISTGKGGSSTTTTPKTGGGTTPGGGTTTITKTGGTTPGGADVKTGLLGKLPSTPVLVAAGVATALAVGGGAYAVARYRKNKKAKKDGKKK